MKEKICTKTIIKLR